MLWTAGPSERRVTKRRITTAMWVLAPSGHFANNAKGAEARCSDAQCGAVRYDTVSNMQCSRGCYSDRRDS